MGLRGTSGRTPDLRPHQLRADPNDTLRLVALAALARGGRRRLRHRRDKLRRVGRWRGPGSA